MNADMILRQFVLATYPILFATLLRWVRNHATAEDLTQTTYQVVLRYPGFDPSRPEAVAFLTQQGRWLAQDHYRRQQSRSPDPLPDHLADPYGDQPDQIMARDEVRDRVRRGVALLPEVQRAVMVRHLDGMDHKAIAADLQVPIKVVYRNFHHGKAALRRILEKDGQAAW